MAVNVDQSRALEDHDKPAATSLGDGGEMQGALIALEALASDLEATAQHHLHAVRQRGDMIDALLAEMREARSPRP